MEANMTVKEVSKITGKGELFIRYAIKNGSFPGAYSINENGHAGFFIPKLAFYKFFGYSDKDAKKLIIFEEQGISFEEAQKMVLLEQDQEVSNSL
mgnify:CR=1 FL=1